MGEKAVAIIGLGCRFPRAKNPQEFWQLLRNGTDAIAEVPSTRWNIDNLSTSKLAVPENINSRWGGFLEDVDRFDPQFFGISPREATTMDPQQRLVMEVAYEALEDAGLPLEKLKGTQTGVFVGISSFDYNELLVQETEPGDSYGSTGKSLSITANRLSYTFDLYGPSMAVDTACSSSLVAVHLACRSLQNKEATIAIAGGVHLLLSPITSINLSKAGFLSPDGRCKTFDAAANGYVRSEGCGMVILKPLSQAVADRDCIYAVIRGSAINQDGRSNGLTAPNPRSQEMLLQSAYENAGISPGQVQYVEAHGTGTKLGDPIEIKSLGKILACDRAPDRPCAVGSVKTNIGHLEAASGIAGLIKVVLSIKHQEIPPQSTFSESQSLYSL